MGLGKTVVSLTAISEYLDCCDIKAVLYIAPLRVLYSVVRQEAKKWDHLNHLKFQMLHGKDKLKNLDKPADIYLLNPEGVQAVCSLISSRVVRNSRNKFKKFHIPFDMIVVDEATKFKSRKSRRFKVLKKIAPIFIKRILMSGTPQPNSLVDMWSQICLLDDGKRLHNVFGDFKSQYLETDYSGFRLLVRTKRHEKQIYSKISDLMFEASSKDHLDMPELIMNKMTDELTPKLRSQYDELEKEFFLELDDEEVEVFNIAALSMKLRQFTSGFLYKKKGKKNISLHVHDLKLNMLEEIYENANGKPVLVAYQFKGEHELQRIQKKFKAVHIGSKTDPETSNKIINDWNAGKIKMLLAHPRTAAHGLNIQESGYILVWYSMTWSSEEFDQMIARLWRQGQKSDRVIVHSLIIKNTIDEAILRAVNTKKKGQARLLKAIKDYRRNKS